MVKKYLFSLLLLSFGFGYAYAQDNTDENDIGNGEITYEEELFSLTYYRYGREIGLNIVTELLQDNAGATNALETAKLKRDFATISAGVGVAAIIYTATTSFNEGFNWGIAAGGLGVIGVGSFLYINAKQDAKEAIRIYNNSLPKDEDSESGMTLKVGVTSSGIGLTLSF